MLTPRSVQPCNLVRTLCGARCPALCGRGAPPCAVTLCGDLVPHWLSKIGSPDAHHEHLDQIENSLPSGSLLAWAEVTLCGTLCGPCAAAGKIPGSILEKKIPKRNTNIGTKTSNSTNTNTNNSSSSSTGGGGRRGRGSGSTSTSASTSRSISTI